MKKILINLFVLVAALAHGQESGGYLLSNVPVLNRIAVPMGELSYFDATGTTVDITSGLTGDTANLVVCTPTTVLSNDGAFDNGGSNNGRLRYTGAVTKYFHVACTVSVSPATTNDEFVFGLAKNGTLIKASRVVQKMGATSDTQSTAMHVFVTLATNDYLELYIGNRTAARDVVLKSLNLFAMGM